MYGQPYGYPPQDPFQQFTNFLAWLKSQEKEAEEKAKNKARDSKRWYKPEFSTLELTLILTFISPFIWMADLAMMKMSSNILLAIITK
jgi:hypothetical protein